MQISRLKLENYACFKTLDIKLATKDDGETGSNITVIVGNNGAGKTNILNAIATGLSWFVAKVQDENATGQPIAQTGLEIPPRLVNWRLLKENCRRLMISVLN